MKLLLVTRNFPPLWGGMERLNWHMAAELAKSFEVRVIAPNGAAEHAPPGMIVREAPLKPLRRFLLRAAALARKEAREWRPDIVLAGSGLTAPLAWWAARASDSRTVVYVHGLDLTVPHPVYRALWRPALRRMQAVIANSSATAALAQGIGIAAERLTIVHPGVELPAPDPAARARFRAAQGIAEHAPVLLSVGRLTARKGLREFVGEVLPQIVQAHPDVLLVVVGEAPENALYAQSQSPASIQAAADAAGVGAHLRFLGKLSEVELADAYFGADLHVFPVRELAHDPEGFGMVAVEAAAHGLPTVAYATGGIVDAVADGISGRLVLPGDADAFAAAVRGLLQRPLPTNPVIAFARRFSWEAFGARLCNILLNEA
ncbi:MAG: glycosyltransferase family 4 protein [Thiomonas sp.]|uniref:glycosyltransferase family 4 protein n=1 Tax=Thiomonas sp. TaxID=2047785 RepID=UPI002A3674E9|nr:glycosyltransferase family 4 protein [Thiomonas sp.]MDY0330919.1 glycosyltransferase family 4 protein [Thiomonas sp.]